jgi:hypothetical protein
VLLIDPPLWTAHGRLWSHLVSDTSLEELHEFASRVGIPRRAFEGDHYDVPEERYAECVALGAVESAPREVVRALQRSGLRAQKRKHEKVIHQYLDAPWLPPGSRADVVASRQAEAPAQTVVVRLAVVWRDDSGADRLFVTDRRDRPGRHPDLPFALVADRSPEEEARLLADRYGSGDLTLRGYVRNTVPAPTPDYPWPAPRACFAVWTLRTRTVPVEGDWPDHARAARELGGRHWWPLFAEGFE